DLGPGRTATALAAGTNFTCALLDEGSVRCWGGNIAGQLGQGNTEVIGDDETPGQSAPVDLGGQPAIAVAAGGFHACALIENRRVLTVVAGMFHTCALLEGGVLHCWGSDSRGQLGHDAADLAGARIVEIAAGGFHTCARTADRTVHCWGADDAGQAPKVVTAT